MTARRLTTPTQIAAPPSTPRWPSAIVLVAEVMDLIDGTIVNVAAPRSAPTSAAAQPRCSGSARPTRSRSRCSDHRRALGDIVGRRRLFLVGIVGFTPPSALCAPAVVAGHADRHARRCRAVRRAPDPAGPRDIKEVFAEDEITKAFALFGPVMGLGAVAARSSVARWSTATFGTGWRAIFLVNLPLGVIGLIGACASCRTRRYDPARGSIPSACCW